MNLYGMTRSRIASSYTNIKIKFAQLLLSFHLLDTPSKSFKIVSLFLPSSKTEKSFSVIRPDTVAPERMSQPFLLLWDHYGHFHNFAAFLGRSMAEPPCTLSNGSEPAADWVPRVSLPRCWQKDLVALDTSSCLFPVSAHSAYQCSGSCFCEETEETLSMDQWQCWCQF